MDSSPPPPPPPPPNGHFTVFFSSSPTAVSGDDLALFFTEKAGACRQVLLHLFPSKTTCCPHPGPFSLPPFPAAEDKPHSYQWVTPLCPGPPHLTSSSGVINLSFATLLSPSTCNPYVSVFYLKRITLSQPHNLSSSLPISSFSANLLVERAV